MGADLLTYIAIGPEKLDESEELRRRAVAEGTRRVTAVTAFLELENEADAAELTLHIPQALQFELDTIPLDVDDYETLAGVEVSSAMNDLFTMWNERSFRDVNTRWYNDKQILVAGDSSWGDEPEGGGYQTCKLSDLLGLFEVYGIE